DLKLIEAAANTGTDRIELYNNSGTSQNLSGWTLTDDKALVDRWSLPSISIDPNAFLLIFASGKDKNIYLEGANWESPILPTDTYKWIVPDATIPANWNTLAYDASAWGTGQAGFGYGDGDDNTQVPEGSAAVYIRKNFTLPSTSVILNALCHVDYDDGFVAYLNGVEICRSNISGTPSWDSYSAGNHDAVMFSGGSPEKFEIDMGLLSSIWNEGDNVFAVELHNVSNTSSDLTLIPFLSFTLESGSSFFPPTPLWLVNSENEKLHTNFKIDADGETIYLFDESGILADSLLVRRTELNYSIGRETDGAFKIAEFVNASPGSSNNTQTAFSNGYELSPVFNYPSGFYEDEIEVSMSVGSTTASIRYTTDGSEPSASSVLFNGNPVKITKSSVVRAKSFSSTDKLPSLCSSYTYFINEEYSIPVLSVITDNSNLWGTSGIFSNTNELWNKPCFVEYFDTLKNLAFRQEAGVQVDGGAGGSRTQPQTSFRIEPGHSIFGAGNLKNELQPDRPERENYSSFYLRNGSNQYLILPYKDGAEVKGMGENTYNFYSAYRPVAVHINGKFYGIYELREKINANYLEANYGMNTDSIDLLGVSYFKGMWLQAIEGSIDGFNSDVDYFLGLNPYSSTYLHDVETILDLNNYTDYMIGEMWIGNNDWPQNNIKVWRCPSTNYRWQFALVDLEWALKPNEWTNATFDAIQYLKDRGMSTMYSGFWLRMMDNEEYKNRFINRYADLMNTNYAFSNLGRIEQEMYDEAVVEMPLEYERWGNSDIEGQMENYTANHETFRSELSRRSAYVRSDLKIHYNLSKQTTVDLDVNPPEAGRIKISTIIPENYPWSGIYFSDIPIKVEAIPNPGYTFSGWDNSSYISNNSSNEFTFLILNAIPDFVANFEEGSGSFDGVTISEISYKDGKNMNSTDWFEIHNSTSSPLNLDGWYFTDKDTIHNYFFESMSIPANDRLVVAENKLIFQTLYPDISNFTGGFLFGLDSYNDEIKLYDDQGNLVVSVSYSNQYPWPLSDNVEGRSIELLDPNKDLNDPYNWMAGCPKGSPGKEYKKCDLGSGSNIEKTITPSKDLQPLSVYPNPATDHVNLEFNLNNPVDQVHIKVYNMQGRLIKSETTGSMPIGAQIVSLELSAVPPSQMLFIVVTTDNFHQTVKVIKE
ncbi:MAG: lamin tail domain-containing protein, partial [Bacteroidales bacterium]|nr:lamin tail domain-containing protein [Bacteroidales bacterium]